jgi:hypothetical protein
VSGKYCLLRKELPIGFRICNDESPIFGQVTKCRLSEKSLESVMKALRDWGQRRS